MKHPTTIDKYNGTLEELARDIADLRYDVMGDLLNHLAYEISIDQKKDFDNKRYQLSNGLYDLSACLNESQKICGKVWDICKRHMEE